MWTIKVTSVFDEHQKMTYHKTGYTAKQKNKGCEGFTAYELIDWRENIGLMRVYIRI